MNVENIYLIKGKVSYEDRCKSLNQKGLIIWFTGLSGAGKSTIAAQVEKELIIRRKAAYWLDGDNLRCGLNSDLGFSEKDRKENIRRLAEVAALFIDAGLIVLVSAISPSREMRAFARRKAGGSGLAKGSGFMEVYIKADLTTCEKRDPKGLYKKARSGEILNFTGISSPYEEPENPDIVIDTNVLTIEESVKLVLEQIMRCEDTSVKQVCP